MLKNQTCSEPDLMLRTPYVPTEEDIEVMAAIDKRENKVSDRILSDSGREKVKAIWRAGYVEVSLLPYGGVPDRVYSLTAKGMEFLKGFG